MIDIPDGTLEYCRTGSTYICDPPVNDTDYDLVLRVLPLEYDTFCGRLLVDGWERGGSRDGPDSWASFKKRHTDGILYNFIVTCNESHYLNMHLATEVAKRLNLLNKQDRVMLFHAFIEGEVPF